MKIVVMVRTRNESKRIGKFCKAYKDADVIIVSDGGSDDNTVKIASRYPNVVLRPFTERVELDNGYWRNNDAAHLNFLISQTTEFEPDWIVFDDCDCRPNYLLKRDYRAILEKTIKSVVMVVRIYHWNDDEWFPDFSFNECSLWAWRPNIGFSFIDNPPAYWFGLNGEKVDRNDLHTAFGVLDLPKPYCLLHYSWSEETVAYKIKNYAESGFIPGFTGIDFAGKRAPLLEWMHE